MALSCVYVHVVDWGVLSCFWHGVYIASVNPQITNKEIIIIIHVSVHLLLILDDYNYVVHHCTVST